MIELAGTRREVEASWQHEHGAATGAGSGRIQHVFKVDPNEVRGLRPGECFVMRAGRAVRVQVARAPVVSALTSEFPSLEVARRVVQSPPRVAPH